MIITLAGNNSFLLQRRLNELTSKFLDLESDLALEKIDASDSSYEAILEAVASIPFLASSKMVIIRDLSANKRALESIEQLIDSVSPTTNLVIVESSPDKRTAFYKYLKAKTTLELYEQKEAAELAKWLVDEAKQMQITLSYTIANYLIDRVGINQAILFSELEKLAIFNKEISQESVDLLTEKAPQGKIFDLLDATFSGNKHRALELYEEQRSQKVEPQAILALITWQLHILALAKYGADKSSDQIAKDAKINPYPVQKAQTLARKISPDKLHRMIEDAHHIDYKSKTTSISLDEALKNYIVTL